MIIKVESKITKTVSESLGNEEVANNNFSSASSSASESSDFIIDNPLVFNFELNTTNGATFDEDITLLPTEGRSTIKMIHVQCHVVATTVLESADPVYFDVEMNSVAWGTMSQFQMGNVQALPDLPINISNVVVPANSTAILTIFIGVNKA